jgi:hypothetical protein
MLPNSTPIHVPICGHMLNIFPCPACYCAGYVVQIYISNIHVWESIFSVSMYLLLVYDVLDISSCFMFTMFLKNYTLNDDAKLSTQPNNCVASLTTSGLEATLPLDGFFLELKLVIATDLCPNLSFRYLQGNSLDFHHRIVYPHDQSGEIALILRLCR